MTQVSTTTSLFQAELVIPAIKDSFIKLNPRILCKNPVMFVVAIGSVITTIFTIYQYSSHDMSQAHFSLQISIWLWFTVLFANFAEALAEGRGKAQAENLKKTRLIK